MTVVLEDKSKQLTVRVQVQTESINTTQKTESRLTLSQIKDDSLHRSYGSTVTDKEEKLPLKLATTIIEFLYLEN